MTIDLNTERMSGAGADNGYNLLFGLNDFCLEYIESCAKMLELGCHQGVSTELFSYHANTVHTLDIQARPQRLNRCLNVRHYQGKFKDILPSFKEGSFDLVYIDGNHGYEDVVTDIKDALPLLKKGGVMSGHDYYTEVGRAVKDSLKVDPKIFTDSTWAIRL